MIIVEGGYYSGGSPASVDWMGNAVGEDNSYGLTADAYIGIGFSSGAILLLLCIALLLLTIPIVLGCRKYQGAMVIAGANSMVISAACHVSLAVSSRDMSRTVPPTPTQNSSMFKMVGRGLKKEDDFEMQNLLSQSPAANDASADSNSKLAGSNVSGLEDNNVPEMLRRMRLSRRKLKWGVVRMPFEFYERFSGADEVEHMGFGVEEQDITPPEDGRWYA